jgi:hypothetical protein
MTEGTRPHGMPKADARATELVSDQALENAAFVGAAAVQRIVADRNALRNRLNVQDRELMGLRGAHEEMRQRVVTIQQNYVELAKRIVSQLEQFDVSLRELLQARPDLTAFGGEAAVNASGQRQFNQNGLPVVSLSPGGDAAVAKVGTNGGAPKARAQLEP